MDIIIVKYACAVCVEGETGKEKKFLMEFYNEVIM